MIQSPVALFVIDHQFVGRDTYVQVRRMTETELAVEAPGRRSLRPDLLEGLVGIGSARCRHDDHYEPDIGLMLATTRAIADFTSRAEEKIIAAVMTETEHEVHALIDEAGQLVMGMIPIIGRLSEMAVLKK